VPGLEKSNKRIQEFKKEWKTLWRDRIDDKIRAEGIADKDYSLLHVNRGTVIIATRKYKPLDFNEILQQYMSQGVSCDVLSNPAQGGWGKFIRTTLNKKPQTRKKRTAPLQPKQDKNQQLKKGGRGWLHVRKK